MKWRKRTLAFAAVSILAGYCALPLTTVADITVTVTDQHNRPLTENVTATFLDAQDQVITVIALGKLPSWGNNIHWWAHNAHAMSHMRPDDVRRTAKIRVAARDCVAQTIEAHVTGTYVAPSPMPHGGGPAFMHYTCVRAVQLQCGA